jgi:folate-binding protein YgfZ
MPEVSGGLYKAIIIEGTDAESFLQGQLTQDVGEIPDGGSLPAAWCNPKGRVIVTLTVCRTPGGFLLVVPASMCERTLQRLTMYRLRADVDLLASDDVPDLDSIVSDPAALIEAGIPVIDESNTEAFTPHMLNLDKLGAISFEKGCYTGQEVVARTEHLGKSKRRMMRYEADGDGISVGDKLSDADRSVGAVVNVNGVDLLAVTPVDLHDVTLQSGGVNVTPAGLPYDL